MKIKSALRIIALISVAIASGVVFVNVYQKTQLNNMLVKASVANQIVKAVNQRANVFHSYLIYHKPQSLSQWQTLYDVTNNLLSSKAFNAKDEQVILETMRRDNAEIYELFSALIKLQKEKKSDDLSWNIVQKSKEDLKSTMFDKGNAIVSGAYQLTEINRDDLNKTVAKIYIFTAVSLLTLIALIFFILIVSRNKIVLPLSKLNQGLYVIGEGNLNYTIGSEQNNEIGEIIRAFDATTLKLKQRTAEQKHITKKLERTNKEILYRAQHDTLTGLFNRLYTKETLIQFIRNAKKDKNIVAILYFDIDYFKRINDTIGHLKGDSLLQIIAQRLKKAIRKGDLVARFGGDEFCIVFSDVNSKEDIAAIAKKILKAVAKPCRIDKQVFYITASMGISSYPEDGADPDFLFEQADLAMYQAKNTGRNTFEFSSIEIRDKEKKKGLMEAEMYKGLKNNQFIVYYQPIINIKAHKIVGMEALVRWKNPKGEIVLPEEFIPIAERSDLILLLGEWVLNTASKQFKAWQQYGIDSMAVNITVHHLSERLVNATRNILSELELQPGNLTFEITETMLMEQTDSMMKLNRTLNEMGINISIDDFGTGYSSFTYLNKFSIKYLKIDRSFVQEIKKNPKENAIIKAIIQMAHTLNIKTIAEGVETKEEFEFLKENGCDECQGYYFSKPLPAEEIVKLLHQPLKY